MQLQLQGIVIFVRFLSLFCNCSKLFVWFWVILIACIIAVPVLITLSCNFHLLLFVQYLGIRYGNLGSCLGQQDTLCPPFCLVAILVPMPWRCSGRSPSWGRNRPGLEPWWQSIRPLDVLFSEKYVNQLVSFQSFTSATDTSLAAGWRILDSQSLGPFLCSAARNLLS
jgi:hypothetical protein